MRTMNAESMIIANGGKYRYMCDNCGKKFALKTGFQIHNFLVHILTADYIRLK